MEGFSPGACALSAHTHTHLNTHTLPLQSPSLQDKFLLPVTFKTNKKKYNSPSQRRSPLRVLISIFFFLPFTRGRTVRSNLTQAAVCAARINNSPHLFNLALSCLAAWVWDVFFFSLLCIMQCVKTPWLSVIATITLCACNTRIIHYKEMEAPPTMRLHKILIFFYKYLLQTAPGFAHLEYRPHQFEMHALKVKFRLFYRASIRPPLFFFFVEYMTFYTRVSSDPAFWLDKRDSMSAKI